jgi:uncharacterized protein
MLINAEHLLQFQRCKRRPYLDIHGKCSEIDATNDLLLKLQQDKISYQRTVLAQWNYSRPNYQLGDWQKGSAGTIELMQQGVECIHQGVLLAKYLDLLENENSKHLCVAEVSSLADTGQIKSSEQLVNLEDDGELLKTLSASFYRHLSVSPSLTEAQKYTLVSCPDLLIKQPGQSCFGDWIYVPVSIELGKRPKQEYQVLATFHAQVLAIVQQAQPQTAWLILRGKQQHYCVDLTKWQPHLQDILQEFIQSLEQLTAPELFISRQRCNLCHWYSSCYAIAQSQKHLSLLPGITPVRYTQLKALNITTVESLSQTSPATLENLPGFDREVAYKLVLQAQSILENRPIVLTSVPVIPHGLETGTANTASLTKKQQKLPPVLSTKEFSSKSAINQEMKFANSVELYFDIEAQPDLNLDYLLGVLVVDKQTNKEKFYSLLAHKPEDEELIWQQFLDLVWQYPEAPIYHFCAYEADAVKRLAKLYHTPEVGVQPILNRFVDVYEKLTRSVALPVESYALKTIARWLGFEWRDPQASGARCIYWYDRWLKTGDRSLLEVIQRYNEDDCRATRSVKDWLVNFFQDRYYWLYK